MGSKPFDEIDNYLILVPFSVKMRVSSKKDGFENPSLKIDGFGRTHRTHADETPEVHSANCGGYSYMVRFMNSP